MRAVRSIRHGDTENIMLLVLGVVGRFPAGGRHLALVETMVDKSAGGGGFIEKNNSMEQIPHSEANSFWDS
jgi:hypothetical protein